MRKPVARHLVADISADLPRHWHSGDSFRTHLFNAMSIMFPVGEQYFIDSVRHFRDQLRSPDLKIAVRNFAGQEAAHRHRHAQFNEELAGQGFPNIVAPFMEWRIRMAQGMRPRDKLALSAAYKHLTSVFSDGLLRYPEWTAGMASSMKLLWSWHAMEEIDHKAVAFDVYREIGGGGAARIGWYLYACLMFTIDLQLQLQLQLVCLLRRDRQLWRWRTFRSALAFCLGARGVAWHMVPRCLSYLRYGFHPWRENNSALVDNWLRDHAGDFREIA